MNFFCPNCGCQLASFTGGKEGYVGVRCLRCKTNWKFNVLTGRHTYNPIEEEKPPGVDNPPKTAV